MWGLISMRFTIKHLLFVITIGAFVIATIAFSGGYLVYLPFLIILITGFATLRQTWHHFSSPKSLSLVNHWKLGLFGSLCIASIVLYVPMSGYAFSSFASKQEINQNRQRILGLNEPEATRKACRQLHAILMAMPLGEQHIDGDSKHIPPDIACLNPISIFAKKNVLHISLFRNHKKSLGIWVFPEGATMQTGQTMIIDGLWLWESD